MARHEFVDLCLELLGPCGGRGGARAKAMFGGHGLYLDGLFVAIVVADRLYLKVDAATRPAFEAAGCEPFVYQAAGRTVAMGYWSVPAEALESPALMQPWARRALQAALASRSRRRPGPDR
jgi:DNA transformation protein and related proteins